MAGRCEGEQRGEAPKFAYLRPRVRVHRDRHHAFIGGVCPRWQFDGFGAHGADHNLLRLDGGCRARMAVAVVGARHGAAAGAREREKIAHAAHGNGADSAEAQEVWGVVGGANHRAWKEEETRECCSALTLSSIYPRSRRRRRRRVAEFFRVTAMSFASRVLTPANITAATTWGGTAAVAALFLVQVRVVWMGGCCGRNVLLN